MSHDHDHDHITTLNSFRAYRLMGAPAGILNLHPFPVPLTGNERNALCSGVRGQRPSHVRSQRVSESKLAYAIVRTLQAGVSVVTREIFAAMEGVLNLSHDMRERGREGVGGLLQSMA